MGLRLNPSDIIAAHGSKNNQMTETLQDNIYIPVLTDPGQSSKVMQVKKMAGKDTYFVRNHSGTGIKMHNELSQQLTFKNKFQESYGPPKQ